MNIAQGAHRLGVTDKKVLSKAEEYLRTLNVKCKTKALASEAELAKSMVCLDLSCQLFGHEYKREQLIKYAGTGEKEYQVAPCRACDVHCWCLVRFSVCVCVCVCVFVRGWLHPWPAKVSAVFPAVCPAVCIRGCECVLVCEYECPAVLRPDPWCSDLPLRDDGDISETSHQGGRHWRGMTRANMSGSESQAPVNCNAVVCCCYSLVCVRV